MPYNFNGEDVDINNITLQHLLDGIIGDGVGIGTTSTLLAFGSGGDARMNLLRYGMNSLDTFFGSKYTDEYKKDKILDANGLLATCIQHEIDHLNGILFIDHLSKLKREIILKKAIKEYSKS